MILRVSHRLGIMCLLSGCGFDVNLKHSTCVECCYSNLESTALLHDLQVILPYCATYSIVPMGYGTDVVCPVYVHVHVERSV